MGLFSSVLHVHKQPRAQVLVAMNLQLASFGFEKGQTFSISTKHPYEMAEFTTCIRSGPCYLVSDLQGDWLTIIQSHLTGSKDKYPFLADVAQTLSEQLKCHTVSLLVHDDDVFLYNLYQNGSCLDGYDSNPQYFLKHRMSYEDAIKQLHSAEQWKPLMPSGKDIKHLEDLLNRGWWNAFRNHKLDSDGCEPSGGDGFTFEGERMNEFGSLLELHGSEGEYPFAEWGSNEKIKWSEFIAIHYTRPTK